MLCSSLCYTHFHDRDDLRSPAPRPDERPPGRGGPQRPADPGFGPGGVRRRPRRADHRGGQARGRRHQRAVHPLRQQGRTPPHAVHRRPGHRGQRDRGRPRARQARRRPLARLRRLHAQPGRRGYQLDDPRLRRQVRPDAGDVRPGQPVKRAHGRTVRPDPGRAPARPGAARRLAGVRAGGRHQVRRSRADRRAASPLPGAHPGRHAGRRPRRAARPAARPGRRSANAGELPRTPRGRAGPGPGACPRAWPGHGRPGSRAPPRPGQHSASAAPAAARPTRHGRPPARAPCAR